MRDWEGGKSPTDRGFWMRNFDPDMNTDAALSGDTIASMGDPDQGIPAMPIGTNVTVKSYSFDPLNVTVELSGGLPGATASVSMTVKTAKGQVWTRTSNIYINPDL
ncbi:MAG: hypothetical protein JO326_03400 [Acetobacteraceae bacterium]|nr:hypothetical protein [Acetobacteraceae bacterium]